MRNGIGVSGGAPSGTGVYGAGGGTAAAPPPGTGVYGTGTSSGVSGDGGTNAIGVYGRTATNVGVSGAATGSGFGVKGQTSTGIGVYGESTGHIGVIGGTNSGYGVYGSVLNGGPGYAGYFNGKVRVEGTFTVQGTKSAAVPGPDGELRRVYCQESPEPWFEDFGAGTLANGRADLRLDAEFSAIVKSDDYAVFLTPEGDCKGLYVTAKTPAGFQVRELQGGTSAIPFGYRLVARRKDIAGPRLEKVERPKKVDQASLTGSTDAPAQPTPTPGALATPVATVSPTRTATAPTAMSGTSSQSVTATMTPTPTVGNPTPTPTVRPTMPGAQ